MNNIKPGPLSLIDEFSCTTFIDLVLHDSCEELMADSSVKILPHKEIAGT
jgi:hypothetical protein